MTRLRDGDGGQALVIAALAMVVLMGALALSVDLGYGYVLRRGLQNQLDAAALAAARRVVSTFELRSGGARSFTATQEEVCNDVAALAAGAGAPIEIAFFADPSQPGTWTSVSTANCASGRNDAVPPDTIYVRVRATRTFRSLFDAVTRQPITVSASARARLTGSAGCDTIDCVGLRPLVLPTGEEPGTGVSGNTTAPNAAIWPMAIHFDISDFDTPCGQYCDSPTAGRRVAIWPRASYGSGTPFTGLVTFTHFSPREFDDGSDQVHQFTTESDYTGTTDAGVRSAHDHDTDMDLYPFAQMPNADSRACGGAGAWDTLGRQSLSDAARCDVPNWFAYGFRGSVGLGSDWSGSFNALPGVGVDRPEPLTSSRSSCDRSVYLPRPSCIATSNRIGDWVETVPGDLTPLMADLMLDFIGKYGRTVPTSSQPIANGAGAPLHGKAVVVYIPIWDCAERFDPTRTDATRWALVAPPGGDCSTLSTSSSVARVHVASMVPFTFYEGLIKTSPVRVDAYWGDVFGEAGLCSRDARATGCGLNELINSAFLVPDE